MLVNSFVDVGRTQAVAVWMVLTGTGAGAMAGGLHSRMQEARDACASTQAAEAQKRPALISSSRPVAMVNKLPINPYKKPPRPKPLSNCGSSSHEPGRTTRW